MFGAPFRQVCLLEFPRAQITHRGYWFLSIFFFFRYCSQYLYWNTRQRFLKGRQMNEPTSSQSSKAGIVCCGLSEALGGRLHFDASWLESSIVATDFLLWQTFFAERALKRCTLLEVLFTWGLTCLLGSKKPRGAWTKFKCIPWTYLFRRIHKSLWQQRKKNNNIKKRGSLVQCHWNGEDSTHKPSFWIFLNMNWLLSPVSGEPLEITSVFVFTHRVPKETEKVELDWCLMGCLQLRRCLASCDSDGDRTWLQPRWHCLKIMSRTVKRVTQHASPDPGSPGWSCCNLFMASKEPSHGSVGRANVWEKCQGAAVALVQNCELIRICYSVETMFFVHDFAPCGCRWSEYVVPPSDTFGSVTCWTWLAWCCWSFGVVVSRNSNNPREADFLPVYFEMLPFFKFIFSATMGEISVCTIQ